MPGFLLLPDAEADLDQIWLYVAQASSSIDVANRLVDRITDTLWLLAQHPQIGRRRDYDLRPDLRSFPVGEYVVIYRIEADVVVILHIFRGSRDISGLME